MHLKRAPDASIPDEPYPSLSVGASSHLPSTSGRKSSVHHFHNPWCSRKRMVCNCPSGDLRNPLSATLGIQVRDRPGHLQAAGWVPLAGALAPESLASQCLLGAVEASNIWLPQPLLQTLTPQPLTRSPSWHWYCRQASSGGVLRRSSNRVEILLERSAPFAPR